MKYLVSNDADFDFGMTTEYMYADTPYEAAEKYLQQVYCEDMDAYNFIVRITDGLSDGEENSYQFEGRYDYTDDDPAGMTSTTEIFVQEIKHK